MVWACEKIDIRACDRAKSHLGAPIDDLCFSIGMRSLLRLFILFIALGGVLLLPTAAVASCSYAGPVCQTYQNYDAVFDGTVISIERLNVERELGGRRETSGHRLVTFALHETWKGLHRERVQLLLAGGYETSVSTSLLGARYLIFANDDGSGYLSTSSCSPSQPYGPGATLDFLRSLRLPPAGGRIYGLVSAQDSLPWRAAVDARFDTQVTLEGEGITRTVLTQRGEYEFAGLSPGSYGVSIDVPRGFTGGGPGLGHINIPRGCDELSFRLAPDTYVGGVVLSASGKPVPDLEVELADVRWKKKGDPEPLTATTDETGSFRFRGIPPGRYVVGVNLKDKVADHEPYRRTTFSDGDSETAGLLVESGRSVDLGVMHLPRPSKALRLH